MLLKFYGPGMCGNPGRVLPLCWVIWMCRRFDPLFWHSGDWTRSFGGTFSHPLTPKRSFGGTKTTNPYRIRSFWPQIPIFPRSFGVQFSAASGTPPSVFGPSTPPPGAGIVPIWATFLCLLRRYFVPLPWRFLAQPELQQGSDRLNCNQKHFLVLHAIKLIVYTSMNKLRAYFRVICAPIRSWSQHFPSLPPGELCFWRPEISCRRPEISSQRPEIWVTMSAMPPVDN